MVLVSRDPDLFWLAVTPNAKVADAWSMLASRPSPPACEAILSRSTYLPVGNFGSRRPRVIAPLSRWDGSWCLRRRTSSSSRGPTTLAARHGCFRPTRRNGTRALAKRCELHLEHRGWLAPPTDCREPLMQARIDRWSEHLSKLAVLLTATAGGIADSNSWRQQLQQQREHGGDRSRRHHR